MQQALVTGGHGGMAQAITRALGIRRWHVFCPGRSTLDVTDDHAIESYVRSVKPQLLVNSAGYINPCKVDSLSAMRELRKHLDVNLIGAVKCASEVLRYASDAIVINISSASGLGGRGDGWGFYSIAKAGAIAFTESLTAEGYTAYTISPHRTATKMRKVLFPDEDQGDLMRPERIGEVVIEILDGCYPLGSNIEVSKDEVVVHENRYHS
jgi:NAD(P)-dependent dehydrogenase (short-subunit alcohol dehydrogenase family)